MVNVLVRLYVPKMQIVLNAATTLVKEEAPTSAYRTLSDVSRMHEGARDSLL